MKRTLWNRMSSLLLTLCLLAACATLFASCGTEQPPEGTLTRVTVDVNPSVEFMVDDQNQIVSVTALNDDGSILIAGEAFVGMTPEEGVELVVKLAGETGYLVSGNGGGAENAVTLTVSGDTKYAEQLEKQLCTATEKVLDALNVEGTVAAVEAMKIDALRQLAGTTSLYTDEELAAMGEEDLYKVIAAGRVETALLLTEEMRQAYYTAKEYEISFAEREETAKVIEAMGGVYKLVHTGYKTALELYSNAIVALDEFRYDTLVSPESDYQKKLAELREKKSEYLKQRTYTASLDVNGEEYASASLTLQMSEEQYEAALAAYEQLGTEINAAMESLLSALREAESALIAFEEEFFSDDIEAELQAKATEMEANLNAAKDAFFTKFEEAHAEDIRTMEASLLARKQALQQEIEAE